MKPNLGGMDRMVRIIAAAVIAALYFTGVLHGTWAIVLLVLGAVLLLTSFVSFCPLYRLLGISTRKK